MEAFLICHQNPKTTLKIPIYFLELEEVDLNKVGKFLFSVF